MKHYGTKVSNGLGLGKCVIINDVVPEVNDSKINSTSIDNEILKVNNSIDECIKSYENIINSLVDEDLKQLCDFNKMVLKAKSLKTDIENNIRENLINGAYAITSYFNKKADDLSKSDNNYLKERSTDIIDIKDKVLKSFMGIKSFDLSEIKEDSILVAHEITPNILLSGDLYYVKGIISEIGGKTSHVGILANTLGIPAVFGIKDNIKIFSDGELLFINGNSSYVENELDFSEINNIKELIKKEIEIKKELDQISDKAYTIDNKYFEVCANSGDLVELDKIDKNKIDGVGLFRTEFLYLNKQVPPTEEYLFNVFKNFAEKLGDKKVIIRTLDIGGDKKCSYIDIPKEENPFLGYRAIRYCIDNKELFKTLLKAILRASVYGNISIMYPMISSLEDIKACNAILNEAKSDLDGEEKIYNKNINVGVMVEIPSIAVCAEEIIKYVDFFSIGTNDLVQYTLAVDRVNPHVSKYYNWFNPGVIKLIKNTIDSTKKYENKFTGMCGELAADPLGIILLVGLGLDEFSVNINSVNKVKKLISLLNYEDTNKFVNELLELDSSLEIEKKLDEFAKKNFGKYY